MGDKLLKKKLIIYPALLVLLVNIVFAATLTMNVPANANAGQQFQVPFSTTDATGNYAFLTSLDVISGVCIPDHQSGMIISPFTSANFNINAPQSAGTCILEGKYRFVDIEDHGWVSMPAQTITILGTGNGGCSCTDWVDIGCVGTTIKQIRTCTPSGCDENDQYIADSSCEATTSSGCEFYEQSTETGCKTAGWVYIVGILFGVIILLKILPSL